MKLKRLWIGEFKNLISAYVRSQGVGWLIIQVLPNEV